MDLDYLAFIGRFEPFHNGHVAAARHALRLAPKLVLLVGASDTPRTMRNPWSFTERSVMIQAALEDASDRLIIRPLRDHLYSEALWIADVQRAVTAVIEEDVGTDSVRVGVIGKENDAA